MSLYSYVTINLREILKNIVLLVFITTSSCKSIQVNSTGKVPIPNGIDLVEQLNETVSKQKEEFYRLFRKDTINYKSYSVEFMLNKIDNDSDYEYIFISEYWIVFNYKKMIPELIEQITDNT